MSESNLDIIEYLEIARASKIERARFAIRLSDPSRNSFVFASQADGVHAHAQYNAQPQRRVPLEADR